MKKILSLVLALCLLCLSVSALAEIPASVEDLPAATMDVAQEDFFGEWSAVYAVYDDDMASLKEVAPILGGSVPVVTIDAEKVTATYGEGDGAKAVAYDYIYNAEYSSIEIYDPETYDPEAEYNDPVIYIQMMETEEIQFLFVESMVELYMAKAEEAPEA